MGGGLMQLVAVGAADIYLTGNPQITFFKTVYKRYTNFSMESIEQSFNGTAGYGKKVSATISKNGDLVGRMYLEHQVIIGTTQTEAIHYGHNLLKEIELEIGGNLIDKHYSQWLQIWNELSNNDYKMLKVQASDPSLRAIDLTTADGTTYASEGYMRMAGDYPSSSESTYRKLYIPLQFWFCRNPGLALPLIALQYNDVKLTFTFQSKANCVNSSGTFGDTTLWVDYIYLDADERRKFAQISHEYLIEQVQFTGVESVTQNTLSEIEINFNHPIKELIWAVASDTGTLNMKFLNLAGSSIVNAEASGGSGSTGGSCKAKLLLNGSNRFTERWMTYFTRVQPHQHHTNIPLADRIGVYSFALNPEEHQPSGTCNFSKIDNAILEITPGNTGSLYVFGVNYNILRIMSGQAGLAYAN